MKWVLLIMIFSVLSGCSSNSSNYAYLSSKKEKAADNVIQKAALTISTKYGLDCIGSGGRMMDEIKMLALSFRSEKEFEMGEGRDLLVSILNDFLSIVNQDEEIRPYLVHYPFEIKNIKILLFIKYPDTRSPESLSVISSEDGLIEYDITNIKTGRLETFYKETYDEAVMKIQLRDQRAA